MGLSLWPIFLMLFLQPGINSHSSVIVDDQDASMLPRFTWRGEFSIHIWFPSGVEDIIKLWTADPVGDETPSCLYEGVLEVESPSSVAVSGCWDDDLVNIVIYTNLLPDHTMFNIRNGVTEEVQKVVFDETRGIQESHKRRIRKRGTYLGDDYDDFANDGAAGIPDPPPFLRLDVKLAFEETLLAKTGSEDAAREYIARVFTLGKHHLRHSTLGTSIRLKARGPIRRIHNEHWKPVVKDLMESKKFKEQESVPITFFCYNEDRSNDTGISYPRRGCHEDKGVAIVAARDDLHQSAQTYIHECGHWLGFQHDALEDEYKGTECEGTGIMSNASTPGGRPSKWSLCSKRRLKTWLSKPDNNCLQPDDKALQLEDSCMAVNYDSVVKFKPKCQEVTVLGANYADCNGDYRVSEESVPWSPSRPVYEHVSSDRFIFWTAKGHGWVVGNKEDLRTGNYYHYSSFDSSEPWEAPWSNGINVQCKGNKGCDLGWKQFEAKCYKEFPTPMRTQSSAWALCQNNGGNLVSLETREEEIFLENMLDQARKNGVLSSNKDIWLSAKRPSTDSPFVWNTAQQITWSDWYPGQPVDTHGGTALCLQIFKNNHQTWRWHVANCDGGDSDNAVVCEKTEKQGCQLGWRKFGVKCYKLYPESNKIQSDAQALCQTQEADLVSLETEEEETFLENMLDQARKNGVLSTNKDIWLSAKRPSTDSLYVWNPGQQITWSDWYPGQPTDTHFGIALCLQIFKNNHQTWRWHGTNCDGGDTDNAVVCEKDSKQVINECPANWRKVIHGCYNFLSKSETWSQARETCRKMKAKLAEPRTKEAAIELIKIAITDHVGSDYWLGLSDVRQEGTWTWDTDQEEAWKDSEWNDGVWHAGEPNNYGGNEDCAYMANYFGMEIMDVSCNDNAKPVCQMVF